MERFMDDNDNYSIFGLVRKIATISEATAKHTFTSYKGEKDFFSGFSKNKIEIVKTSSDTNKDIVDNDNDVADINTKEREHMKDTQQYQQYQENQQNQQPWSDSSDIRIVDSDELPDPLPITDTEVCSKCGNHQAEWWIVQTDSADEPSTQFFRCTKCKHTWRTTRSS